MSPDFSYIYPVNADGKTIALVPLELIWTEDYRFLGKKIESHTPAWEKVNNLWGSRPILRLRPHLNLFEYFTNGSPYPDEYLDWHEAIYTSRNIKPPLGRHALLDHRFDSFRSFTHNFENNAEWRNYFAADAVYDPKGNRFVLNDGHHRCAFLTTRGLRKLPLLISFDDLKSWLNIGWTWSVNECIKTQNRSLIYSPILNPMVLQPSVVRDFSYKSRIDHLLRFFGPTPFPHKILDIGCNAGFFSFHLAREGSTVVGCDTDASHIALAQVLSSLYRLTPKFINIAAEDFLQSEDEYDAVLLLTVLYHLISLGKHGRLLTLLDLRVRDCIIWESGDCPRDEIEIITMTTKFSNYKKIASTFGTGKNRELGIFHRDGWFPPNEFEL